MILPRFVSHYSITASFQDCGGDLDVVWRVFFNLMRETIEECCRNPPRSPVRELLEREHDKAKFSLVFNSYSGEHF